MKVTNTILNKGDINASFSKLMKTSPSAWKTMNNDMKYNLVLFFSASEIKDISSNIYAHNNKVVETPSIRRFRFITMAGRFGIRYGSLKYLRLESNMMLFTDEEKPRTVRKNKKTKGRKSNENKMVFFLTFACATLR